MIVTTIRELIDLLPTEIVEHVQKYDDEFPSFSVETLKEETPNILDYLESSNNYTPYYYGCGLICRCLSLAKDRGAIFTPSLFLQLGVTPKGSEYLAGVKSWY